MSIEYFGQTVDYPSCCDSLNFTIAAVVVYHHLTEVDPLGLLRGLAMVRPVEVSASMVQMHQVVRVTI